MAAAWAPTLAAATAVSYKLPWGTIRGLCWGDPKDVRCVCTHGWLDNAHSFLPLAEHWKAADGGLVALDWAGHGTSDHRAAGHHYHFIDYAYDLWNIIEQQNWQQITLVGHSMGGFVANVVASLCGERLRHLVLIEALGLLVSDEQNAAQQLHDGFQSRAKLAQPKWRDYAELSSAVDARAKSADFSRQLVEVLVQRGCYRNSKGRWQWRADPRVKAISPYRLPAQTVRQLLTKISCPVTLLRGEQGYATLDHAIDAWRDCIAQFSCEFIAGGHHAHMENPESLAAAITRAIDGE